MKSKSTSSATDWEKTEKKGKLSIKDDEYNLPAIYSSQLRKYSHINGNCARAGKAHLPNSCLSYI